MVHHDGLYSRHDDESYGDCCDASGDCDVGDGLVDDEDEDGGGGWHNYRDNLHYCSSWPVAEVVVRDRVLALAARHDDHNGHS